MEKLTAGGVKDVRDLIWPKCWSNTLKKLLKLRFLSSFHFFHKECKIVFSPKKVTKLCWISVQIQCFESPGKHKTALINAPEEWKSITLCHQNHRFLLVFLDFRKVSKSCEKALLIDKTITFLINFATFINFVSFHVTCFESYRLEFQREHSDSFGLFWPPSDLFWILSIRVPEGTRRFFWTILAHLLIHKLKSPKSKNVFKLPKRTPNKERVFRTLILRKNMIFWYDV